MGTYGGMRSARWLKTFSQAPMVTAFRNLESGQVLFSQTLHPQQYYIDQQFKWPNWQNKKPTLRKDLWRPLAVAEVPSHEMAVQLYRNLVELRHQRDMYSRKQARDWRRKSAEGNIWFWNQYRPTYAYEAVADIVSSLEAMNLNKETPAIIHWEEPYRKGEDHHWAQTAVEHRQLPVHNSREQFVVLNRVRQEALSRQDESTKMLEQLQIAEDRERVAAGEPTRAGELESQIAALRARREKVNAARLRAKEERFAKRPELVELERRGEAVERAVAAWRQAKSEFDPYTPRGERGAAKRPIKLRDQAARHAKRLYRDLKRRISSDKKKRRVPQPRPRMQRQRVSL